MELLTGKQAYDYLKEKTNGLHNMVVSSERFYKYNETSGKFEYVDYDTDRKWKTSNFTEESLNNITSPTFQKVSRFQ